MNDQCIHEGNGTCDGELTVVENPVSFRRFVMCQKHADWYYDQQAAIIRRYPEVVQADADEGSDL